MARSMFDALTDEEKRGTLANPGIASPLGPTLSMKTGAFLHPLLQAAKDKFPKDNPRGRWLGEMLLGDSPQRTGRVAEGIPDQYFHFNRGSGSNVSPQIVDLAAALPIASTLKLAKAAIPVAKAAAVPAGMFAASRAVEPLLGISASTKIPNSAVTSTDDIASALLGQSLQATGDLNKAMVGGDAGAAALARIGNTAPQQAMELAEQMESAGRSRDEIWAATADMGYPVFRGPDGKLRFEIDDSAMAWDDDQYKRFRRMREGSEMPLKDAMTHPELYDAYPEMRDTTLFRGKSQEEGGSAAPYGYEYIRANTGFQGPQADKPDMLSVLGHESQHLIQGGADNFARGGSLGGPYKSGELDQLIQRKYEQIKKLPGNAGETKAALYNHAKKLVNSYEGRYEAYRQLAGETEARAVQKRMDMTPEERAARPFYADFDVPEADQIVRYGDGPSAMVTYQGSPHKFDALDPTKIGTGEGAQAFGHGLYVAQDPRVGGGYRDDAVQNAYLNNDKNYARALDSGLSSGEFDAFESMVRRQGGGATPENLADEFFATNKDWAPLKNNPEEYENIRKFSEDYLTGLPEGYLYEIDVPDEDIAKMLDWDAPLSEQPWFRDVKELAAEYKKDGKPADNYAKMIARANARGDVTGKQFYEGMTGTPAERSAFLERAGIPGIKYYDQGSRGAEEGTRNMVLFDDLASRAKVLKRNDETIAQPSVDEFIGKLLDEGGESVEALSGEPIPDEMVNFMGENLTKEQRAARTAELRAEANALRFGDDDYKIQHSSPAPEGKNSIDDPSDIYDHNIYGAKGAQYYGTGDPAMDKATIKILNEVKQNPDSLVTIYRAVPSDVDDAINAGDWITINKDYAKSHGESALNGDYKIIEQQARAGDIFTNGDSLHEQGWHPGNRDPAIATTLEPSVDLIKRDDMWELSKIETPLELRGKGLADAELTKILEEADTAGVPIGLTPSTAFGANKNKLTKWYKRHGFVPNKGRNKNFLTRESMIRHPRKIAEPSVDEFIGKLLED